MLRAHGRRRRLDCDDGTWGTSKYGAENVDGFDSKPSPFSGSSPDVPTGGRRGLVGRPNVKTPLYSVSSESLLHWGLTARRRPLSCRAQPAASTTAASNGASRHSEGMRRIIAHAKAGRHHDRLIGTTG